MIRRGRSFGLLLLVAGAALLQGAALPGTNLLQESRDWKRETTAQLDALLMQRIGDARALRPQYWQRDFSSLEAYQRSIAANRQRLRERIGAIDSRVEVGDLNFDAGLNRPALRAETASYEVYAVQWPVLDGISAAGLLLKPKGSVVAGVVVIPDADQPPEMLAGLLPGVPPDSAMYTALKAFVRARLSADLPEHRRIDRARAEVRPYNRTGDVALTLTVKDGDFDYGAQKLIHLVHEIYLDFLCDGRYRDYMIANLGLDPDLD